eukprot:994931_1
MADNEIGNDPTLSIKATVTETNRTLDLSPIIDKLEMVHADISLDSYDFIVDDLTFSVRLYPNRKHGVDEPTNCVGLYLEIENPKPNDHRKVYFSFHCSDGTVVRSFVRAVHEFGGSGWGWGCLSECTHATLKKNPYIHVSIKLIHDPLFITKVPTHTFGEQQTQQLQKMHTLSLLLGDVTLVVKLPEFTDDLQPPPKQKRRLNDPHRCEVCDKEFQSKKALTSHQSNKRDQAHKDYKNKNNDNVNSLACNEIKVSSVILRSGSKVFNRMLSTNMIERQ